MKSKPKKKSVSVSERDITMNPSPFSSSTSNHFFSAFSSSPSTQYSSFSFSNPSSSSSSSSSPFSFASPNPSSSSSSSSSSFPFIFTSLSSSSPFFANPNPSPSSASAPSFGFGFSTSSPFSVSAAYPAAPLLFGTIWGWVSSSPCADSALFGSSLVPDRNNQTMFGVGSSSGPGPTTAASPSLFGSASLHPGSTTPTLFGSSSSSSLFTGTSTTFFAPSSSSSVSTGSFSSLFGFGSSSSRPVSTASSSSFGSNSSSLFSTFTTTTTTNASTPVATTTSSSWPAFPAFCVSCSSSSTTTASATAVTSTATSSATTVSFLSSGTSSSPDSSGTTSTMQSATSPMFGTPFSLSGSCSGCSANFVEVGLADEEKKVLCEQVKDIVVKQSIVQTASHGPGEEEVQIVRQDQDEKWDVWEGIQTTIVPTARTSLDVVEVVTFPMVVSAAAAVSIVPTVEATAVTTGTPEVGPVVLGNVVVTPSGGNEVEVDQEEPCVNSSSEAGAPGDGTQTSIVSSLLVDMNEYILSSENGFIIKKVFAKYGDITLGSILKSTAAKSAFLELVADAVDRLCTHTLDTLDSNEFQLIQKQIADAATVGFNVEWLQQRVDKVNAVSKYKLRTMELDELGKQIDAAKKSLMEMEFQQMVLTEELHTIRAEREGSNFSGSNLGEGLL